MFLAYFTEYVPATGSIELLVVPDTLRANERNAQREAFKLAFRCMLENPGCQHHMTNRLPTVPGTLYRVILPNGSHLTFGVTTPEKLENR